MQNNAFSENHTFAAIAAGVRSLLMSRAASLGRATELSGLSTMTHARAVGCWRHDQGVLHLAGFLAVADMPADVQTDFIAATRHVPLTQTQFGIVQSVLARGPAVNHCSSDPQLPASGSIGWLGRFEAASSLAVPLYDETGLRGALAVATRQRIEPEDAVWQCVTAVAEHVFGDRSRDRF